MYPELGPLAEMSGAHSLAAVPLARRLGPTGYLLLFWDQPRTFDTAERAYLASLGDVVGQSMDRVLLREREKQLAVELQHAMLGVPDEIVEVDVATAYRPADSAVEIGGDWYDVVRLSETRTAFIVGDVVGHNLAAAKAMGQIRIAIRTLAPLFPDPAELLARLDPIVEEMDGASPTTLIYAVYDATTRRVVFARAGHPPPLIVHRGGGCSFLEGGRGIALGIIADADRPVATTTLRPGDALILYTDGLIERRGEPIEAGLARLAGVVDGASSCDPERLRDDLLDGLASVEDDVAVLVVRPWEMPFRVRIDADPQHLRDVRARLREWLLQQAVVEDDVDDVLVSSGEAVANAVEHAYLGHLLGDVDVRADLRPDAEAKTASLDVRVTDRGSWRRPAAEGPRGNGQKLMRALADDVRVRSDGAGTAVQLRYTVNLEEQGVA